MIKAVSLCCFLLTVFYSHAQYAGYSQVNNPEPFKKSFASATAATESIQSVFTQEKSLTMLSEKIKSTGKFWFHKPDRIRMEYIQPYAYLMILNAGKIYIKDGQKENKISANSNKLFQQANRVLLDCVGGTMMDNPDFQSRVFENASSYLIEFKPQAKNLSALYSNINITIDKKDLSVLSIGLFEVSGDKTIMRFQNKVFNAQIPASVFTIP